MLCSLIFSLRRRELPYLVAVTIRVANCSKNTNKIGDSMCYGKVNKVWNLVVCEVAPLVQWLNYKNILLYDFMLLPLQQQNMVIVIIMI